MNLKSIHKTNFLNYYNTYSSSFLFFGLLLCIGIANAQVKIGDNPTEISHYSILELQSSNKGLLLPRMNTQERDHFPLHIELLLLDQYFEINFQND